MNLLAGWGMDLYGSGLQVLTVQPLEMSGWSIISDHIIDLNNYLGKKGVVSADTLMGWAKALGAIFALIVAANKAYKMMALDGHFEVLEILRPILFAFLIANTGVIVKTVTAPGAVLEESFRTNYDLSCTRVSELRQQRWDKAWNLSAFFSEKKQAAEETKETAKSDEGFFKQMLSGIGDTLKRVWNSFCAAETAMFTAGVEKVAIFIGEFVFQIAVYTIFLVKNLFLTVLTLFGPIQLACSILPIWKDAWASWISRLVSVSLYGAMAYLVMTFTMYMLQFCYDTDVLKLTALQNSGTGLWDYITSALGTTCSCIVGYFCGAIAMGTVPEISSWVLPGGSASMGASHFIGGLQSKANKHMSGGKL